MEGQFFFEACGQGGTGNQCRGRGWAAGGLKTFFFWWSNFENLVTPTGLYSNTAPGLF
jgi:hypothetical protein